MPTPLIQIALALAPAVLVAPPASDASGAWADATLADALSDPRLAPILERAEEHRLELLIATVDESTDPPTLRRAGFRVDAEYFYPASTIKLCAAVGALQKIQDLRAEGVAVSADTPMVFHPMFDGQTLEERDESNTGDGTITVAHEIRKLFIVSDNRAFNRLLAFVGRDELNRRMHDAGLSSVRIAHALSAGYSREQNRHAPRIDLRLADGSVYSIPPRVSQVDPSNEGVPRLEVGEAEIVGGSRLERPKDFLHSNRIALSDLQDALVMVVRPDVDLGKPGFRLSDEHRALLIEAMGLLPRESVNPVYDPEKYPDDHVKFMLPGIGRVVEPERIRLLNKIGLAYGFTTTTAAISLDGRPPAVFVAGTVYTNANGTLNDNVYEYDGLALPFWADLGEILARQLVQSSSADNERPQP